MKNEKWPPLINFPRISVPYSFHAFSWKSVFKIIQMAPNCAEHLKEKQSMKNILWKTMREMHAKKKTEITKTLVFLCMWTSYALIF